MNEMSWMHQILLDKGLKLARSLSFETPVSLDGTKESVMNSLCWTDGLGNYEKEKLSNVQNIFPDYLMIY